MLHATRPPPHAWPVMSHPGHDLLIQQPHLGAGRNGAHLPTGHEVVPGLMGHQVHNMVGHHLPTTASNGAFSNANSFYNPHHTGFIFPHSSYSSVHPSPRPASREHPAGSSLAEDANLRPQAAPENMRHPSGGSAGSGTPPSPEEGRLATSGPYKQSVIRTSVDQRNCSGSDSTQGSHGSPAAASGPLTPYRMQPPSPANSQLPQKSPFDMTTMGMSKAKPDYPHTSQNSSPGHNSSAFSVARPGSVISSARMSSPYQPTMNIKQEPGSPAQYGAASLVSRAVKQEPNQPNSPRNRNATPPPATTSSSSSPSVSSSNTTSSTPSTPTTQGFTASMDRKGITERVPGQPGFNFPSPQAHSVSASTTPISPAPNIGETNPTRPASKFRYPSGPTAVQNLSPGGESTSTSAMSSREGTPGPQATPGPRHSWCGDESSGPAPNVDISNVQVKEEFGVHTATMRYTSHVNSTTSHDDYSRRPLVNIAHYPSPVAPVSSHMDMYAGYGTYHPAMTPQQVALPPRSLHGMRPGAVSSLHHGFGSGIPGRPLSLPGNSESSSHSNVKIGRRPAHLPKVLKFSDNTLPHGWLRKLKQRKHGKQAGRWDVYIYSPCGVKFASRKKLRCFFEKNNLQYDPEDFDFTPYGRHIEQASHARHHSSSESVARHTGSSCSPTSVGSPSSSSFSSHGQTHSEYKTEFIPPPTPVPQPAHRPYPFLHHNMHPAHQPMFTDYNPMMESPPNASALEVPQHQILNLSQTHTSQTSQQPRTTSTPMPTANPNSSSVSTFPPDIATILNEPSDNQFRQSLREYQSDLSAPRPAHQVASADAPEGMQVDGAENGSKEKEGEDSRFMARTYNLLTASQGDLGEMMDEYSIYPE